MDWQGFARQMAAMARDLLAEHTLDATLEQITRSAVDLVDGCDASGILVLRGDRVSSLAPTEQLVTDSDRLQESLREGPCFDAARPDTAERVFRIPDFTEDPERWPHFVPRCRQLGVGSMMGFLLYTREEELGALNMYSRKPGVFTEDSETAGWLLASHAAVAFSSALTDAQMQEAITTRHMIGEAMGILMGRHRITEEQAFEILRTQSQRTNTKLREVARRVCETGAAER
ncbi:GAF and ANTAR domain-containing protein [Streptomyces capillispiralis]|uniref:GAF domain-containing protein n=1 Tax=Streptomyces capillispiralis TaxID=68182 RepID=A0A561TRC4_9ACTN|nr:GAF and ANTAR domain-containing protein [Streptomyces capillispiralis]TWF89645.1 GAF domain-containing protein [Streptomyces capillispiralis]GHH93964.1 transcription antitermination regulator [Streptomyces capillispiralis]